MYQMPMTMAMPIWKQYSLAGATFSGAGTVKPIAQPQSQAGQESHLLIGALKRFTAKPP